MNRQPRTWSNRVILIAVTIALATAPLAGARDVVVQENEEDSEDVTVASLDIVDACMADVVDLDAGTLEGVRVCLNIRDMANKTERAMYAVEFELDGTSYRVQANWSSEPREVPTEDGSVFASGWAASIEFHNESGWAVHQHQAPFDQDGSTLWWTIDADALERVVEGQTQNTIDEGDTLEAPRAFTYIDESEVDDVGDDLESALSSTLDGEDGADTEGWSMVDAAPGGTGAEYTVADPKPAPGSDYTTGTYDPRDDGSGDDGTGSSGDGGGDGASGNGDGNSDGTNGNGDGTDGNGNGDGTQTTDDGGDPASAPGMFLEGMLWPLAILAVGVALVGIAVWMRRR